MYIVFFILLIFFILGCLLFFKPVKIFLALDTDSADFSVRVRWLAPLLDIKATMADYSPVITVFLFNKQLFSRKLRKRKPGKKKLSEYYPYLHLESAYADTRYSLNNPFETGILSAVFNVVQSVYDKVLLIQYPNFISDHSYLAVQAGADLNVGKSVVQIVRRSK